MRLRHVRVALTPHLQAGDNLISIMVDNSYHNEVLPLMADFTFYGGLYREVQLLVTDDIHFDLMDNGRDGVYLSQQRISPQSFELTVNGQVRNESSASQSGEVQIQLKDHDGNTILESSTELTFKDETPFRIQHEIVDPILWDGVEQPFLYTVTVSVIIEGQIRDSRNIAIGFRTVEATTDRGLLLNDKPIKLNGVCRHQDFGGIGNAITKAQFKECGRRMRMNFNRNCIRTKDDGRLLLTHFGTWRVHPQ